MSRSSRPQKLASGKWRARWLDCDGERQSRVFDRYKEAEAFLLEARAREARVAAGVEPRPPEPRTFGELCDYWLENRTANKRSPKDDRSIIEAHLRPALGGLLLAEVSVQRADQYRRGRRHLSPKTVHNHLTLLIAMLNCAIDLGWLVVKPRIKKPALVEDEYTWLRAPADIARLLEAATHEETGVMELYATAVYTGMRAGELLGLQWRDIDLAARLLTVRRRYDKPTKTGAIRHVPILDPLLPVLEGWRGRCISATWVFPSRSGTMLQPSARVLQETLRRVQARAGVGEGERITFHDFRHTFASHFMAGGGDLFRLQRILGHKSVQMTSRYAHLAPSAYRDDLGRLVNCVPASRGPGVEIVSDREPMAYVA